MDCKGIFCEMCFECKSYVVTDTEDVICTLWNPENPEADYLIIKTKSA